MCYTSVQIQLNMLKEGFFKVIPRHSLYGISSDELEQLICGKPEIDLDDWQKHTNYNKPYDQNHKVIKWFWKAMSEYTQPQRSIFIQFCTGTNRIPIGGFAMLESNRGEYAKFTIYAMPYHAKESPYPNAQTCFNRLILPIYPSYKELKQQLDFIINNEVTGFGID